MDAVCRYGAFIDLKTWALKRLRIDDQSFTFARSP